MITLSTTFIAAFLCLPPAGLWFTDFDEMDSPRLCLSTDYSESGRQQVTAALESDDLKFVRGFSVTRFTTLIYQGDTIPLNKLLGKFSKCPEFSIHVSFKHASDCGHYLYGNDFSIHQSGIETKVHVIINTASERIDLEKLYLPDITASK